MPPKKKTTTTKKTTTKKTTTRTARSKATSTPKTVKVTRTRRAPVTKQEHVIDLRDTLPAESAEDIFAHEGDYQEPYHESPFFDINEESEEETVERPSRWSLSVYQRIAVTFIILSLLSLGTVLYLTYARLDIVIHPQAQAVEAKTSFSVYDRPENYEMPAGSVLGLVRAMEVEATATAPATGKEVTGAEISGTVTIINNYSKDQPLVATTRLLTPDNQLLRLTEGVVVPAGGQVQASVAAETADPSFTLADTHLTIPGLWAGLQDQIYAEAKAGSVTYQEKVRLTVTEADINEATRQGKLSLLEKARQDIEHTYSAYDERLYQLNEDSLNIETDSQVGDVNDAVTVTITGTVTVVAFHENSLTGILGTALSAAGSQEEVLQHEPIFSLISADTNDNVARVAGQVNTTATATKAETIIQPSKIKGLRRNQIEEYLKGISEVGSYELHFRPSFWQWAPSNVKNIKVTIE